MSDNILTLFNDLKGSLSYILLMMDLIDFQSDLAAQLD